MGVENLAPSGVGSLDHPACSKLLYRLHYPRPACREYNFEISCCLQPHMNDLKLLGTLHKPYKPVLCVVSYHYSNMHVIMKKLQDLHVIFQSKWKKTSVYNCHCWYICHFFYFLWTFPVFSIWTAPLLAIMPQITWTALVFDSNVDAKYSVILNPNVGTTHVADICIGAWTQSGRTAEEAGGVWNAENSIQSQSGCTQRSGQLTKNIALLHSQLKQAAFFIQPIRMKPGF